MKKLMDVLCILIAITILASWKVAITEEQGDEVVAPVFLEYSSGTVSEISSQEIVIEKYESEEGKGEERYNIDPYVKIENADSIQDITAGDTVSIEYVVEGDKNIAKVITLEGF